MTHILTPKALSKVHDDIKQMMVPGTFKARTLSIKWHPVFHLYQVLRKDAFKTTSKEVLKFGVLKFNITLVYSLLDYIP